MGLSATAGGEQSCHRSLGVLSDRLSCLLIALLSFSHLASGVKYVHDEVSQNLHWSVVKHQTTEAHISWLQKQNLAAPHSGSGTLPLRHDEVSNPFEVKLTSGRLSRFLLEEAMSSSPASKNPQAVQKQNSTSNLAKAGGSELKTSEAPNKCYCGITGLADWQCGMQCTQVEELASLRNIDVVLYGDSQLESFRGNSWGGPVKRAAGAPEVWAAHYDHLTTVNMALAGQTANSLLHRLDNGALPQDKNTKIAVIWIGTNDLQSDALDKMTIDEKAASVSSDIVKVCERLKQYSATVKVVIMGLLPRGRKYAGHVPNLSELAPLPNKHSEPMPVANQKLKTYADSQEQVEFLDCTSSFITPNPEVTGGYKIDMERAPDVLHFNTYGLDCMLTECLDPAIKQYLGAP